MTIDQIPAGHLVVRSDYNIGTDRYEVLVGIEDEHGQLTAVATPLTFAPVGTRGARLTPTIAVPLQEWQRVREALMDGLEAAAGTDDVRPAPDPQDA